MASTYSTNLRVELMADGENSNTWGGKANNNLNLIEQAVSGVASVTMTDADYTLTTSNAATDEARNMVVTMIGTISQARNVIVPSVDKVYVIKNSTTGGFAITVKTSGGTGVTIPNGATTQLYCDATNVEVSSTVAGKINFTQPANGATLTILNGKTLTANHSLTLAGTDDTVMTFPATSATLARTDAAQTFTGVQDFDGRIDANAGLAVTGANFTSRGITDSATALALTLSGSGANSVTIANSTGSPVIGTSAGSLLLSPGGAPGFAITAVASGVNYISALGSISGGGAVALSAAGTDTDLSFNIAPKGAGNVGLYGATVPQVVITPTASANRYITLTGSNGGNPTIGTSAGTLAIAPANGIVAVSYSGNASLYLQAAAANSNLLVFQVGGVESARLTVDNSSSVYIGTGSTTSAQVRVIDTANADRHVTLTGGNSTSSGIATISTGGTAGGSLLISSATGNVAIGGTAYSTSGLVVGSTGQANHVVITDSATNPTIGTSAGSLNLSSSVNCLDNLYVGADDALGAGGVGSKGLFISSSSIAVIAGSGAPSISAAKGSLYLRSDGSTTNNRMYVNTDGATTWTAVTTVA